jgi:hypothetical protein
LEGDPTTEEEATTAVTLEAAYGDGNLELPVPVYGNAAASENGDPCVEDKR